MSHMKMILQPKQSKCIVPHHHAIMHTHAIESCLCSLQAIMEKRRRRRESHNAGMCVCVHKLFSSCMYLYI